MFFFMVGLLVFLYLFFVCFAKKLLVLLSLEGCMLFLILFIILSYSGGSSTVFVICLMMVLLLVLDSVLGLALLVCSSRNSSNFTSFFSSF